MLVNVLFTSLRRELEYIYDNLGFNPISSDWICFIQMNPIYLIRSPTNSDNNLRIGPYMPVSMSSTSGKWAISISFPSTTSGSWLPSRISTSDRPTFGCWTSSDWPNRKARSCSWSNCFRRLLPEPEMIIFFDLLPRFDGDGLWSTVITRLITREGNRRSIFVFHKTELNVDAKE